MAAEFAEERQEEGGTGGKQVLSWVSRFPCSKLTHAGSANSAQDRTEASAGSVQSSGLWSEEFAAVLVVRQQLQVQVQPRQNKKRELLQSGTGQGRAGQASRAGRQGHRGCMPRRCLAAGPS